MFLFVDMGPIFVGLAVMNATDLTDPENMASVVEGL